MCAEWATTRCSPAPLDGERFLVTGGTGRLGSVLVERILDLGGIPIPLVLAGYPVRSKGLTWGHRTDPIRVTKAADLAALDPPHHVINLHWLTDRTSQPATQLVRELEASVEAPAFLWSWLRENAPETFVNVSSVKVYGSAETGEPAPRDAYGIAKLAAEKFFSAYFRGSSTRVMHLRLCGVASPFGHESQLLNRIAASAVFGKRIQLYGEHSVQVLYVDDVVDLMISAALGGSRCVYNVVSENWKVGTLARRFEYLAGCRIQADWLDARASDAQIQSDFSDLVTEWTRATSLDEMIERMIAAAVGCIGGAPSVEVEAVR